MEISLKQGGCRAGSSWGRRQRSARLTSSVTPTSGNPVRERAQLFQQPANAKVSTASAPKQHMQSFGFRPSKLDKLTGTPLEIPILSKRFLHPFQ